MATPSSLLQGITQKILAHHLALAEQRERTVNPSGPTLLAAAVAPPIPFLCRTWAAEIVAAINSPRARS